MSGRIKVHYEVNINVGVDDLVSARTFDMDVSETGDVGDQVRDVVRTFTREVQGAMLDLVDQIRVREHGEQQVLGI